MVSACSRGECSLGPTPAESTLAWPGPKEFSDVDLVSRRLPTGACCGGSPSLRPAEVDALGLLPQKSLSEAEILLVLSFTDVFVLVCPAYTLVISPL